MFIYINPLNHLRDCLLVCLGNSPLGPTFGTTFGFFIILLPPVSLVKPQRLNSLAIEGVTAAVTGILTKTRLL